MEFNGSDLGEALKEKEKIKTLTITYIDLTSETAVRIMKVFEKKRDGYQAAINLL